MSTKQKFIAGAAAIALFALSGLQTASAGGIRVKCEKSGTAYSKVSVDGRDFPSGNYRARIMSGTNSAQSAPQPTVGGEVEFDFSSKPGDIAAGATPISKTFIRGLQVTGKIIDEFGFTVASEKVNCRVR